MKKDLKAGQLFVDHFPCRTSAGLPTTFTGSVSVLQGTAVTGGITWGASLATTDMVGIYQILVDTASVCYPTGYDYTVIATGTTSGVTVREPVAQFGIENSAPDYHARDIEAIVNALPTVASTPASVAALQVSVNALPTVAATPASIAEILSAIAALPTVAATPASVQAIKVLVDALPTVAMTPNSGAQIISAINGISTIVWLPNAANDLHSSWLNSEEVLTDTGTTLPAAIGAIPTTSSGLSTTQDARLLQILVDTSTNIPADIAGITVTMSTTDTADIADQTADAVVAGLAAQTITVQSPLIDAGTISIIKGDTYNPDKATRLIRFSNTGSWSDLTSATVTIEWTGTGTATCEVFAAGGITTEQSIDVPLSATNTNAMESGPFKIYATWSDPADVETLVIGQIIASGPIL